MTTGNFMNLPSQIDAIVPVQFCFFDETTTPQRIWGVGICHAPPGDHKYEKPETGSK